MTIGIALGKKSQRRPGLLVHCPKNRGRNKQHRNRSRPFPFLQRPPLAQNHPRENCGRQRDQHPAQRIRNRFCRDADYAPRCQHCQHDDHEQKSRYHQGP